MTNRLRALDALPGGELPAPAHLASTLTGAGWTVRSLDAMNIADKDSMFRELQRALRLPESVTNLDALADMLKDLPEFFDAPHIALVVYHQSALTGPDAELWHHVRDILDEAAINLWQAPTPPRDSAYRPSPGTKGFAFDVVVL